MNIRPFNPSDAEYAALVALINRAWPDLPLTVEAVRYSHEHRNPQYFHQRIVVEDAIGRLIAAADYFESAWSHVPGKYSFEMDIEPGQEQAVMQPLYDYMLDKLAQRDPAPQKLVSFSREDKPAMLDFLASHGFQMVMREARSEQDVTAFDFARFDGLAEKLAREGIGLYTLPEIQARDPEWLANYHELEWIIDQDVPSPDPPTRRPLEQFQKMFKHPNFRADGHFIAVDHATGEWVGLSSIWMRPPSTDRVSVGLTGVRRSYRRRGIATALKVRAAAFVRDIGARYATTENEENNPMYALNLKLGFQPIPAWLEFAKGLDKVESENNVAQLTVREIGD